MTTSHLTDEELSDLLSGQSSRTNHLEGCDDCVAELEEIRSALDHFSAASRVWAEREAPRLVPVPSRWSVRWHAIPRWSAATAALLALGSALAFHQIGTPAPRVDTATTVVADTPATTTLAQDNQLLASIDQELSSEVRPQVPVAELRASAGSAHRSVSRRVAN